MGLLYLVNTRFCSVVVCLQEYKTVIIVPSYPIKDSVIGDHLNSMLRMEDYSDPSSITGRDPLYAGFDQGLAWLPQVRRGP